jgi:hypothetical protein
MYDQNIFNRKVNAVNKVHEISDKNSGVQHTASALVSQWRQRLEATLVSADHALTQVPQLSLENWLI